MCGLQGDVNGTGDQEKGMGLMRGREKHEDKNSRRDVPYFEKKKI